MTLLSKAEAERFDRIERSVQYGVTIKDLAWLVRLVRKLDRTALPAPPSLPATLAEIQHKRAPRRKS